MRHGGSRHVKWVPRMTPPPIWGGVACRGGGGARGGRTLPPLAPRAARPPLCVCACAAAGSAENSSGQPPPNKKQEVVVFLCVLEDLCRAAGAQHVLALFPAAADGLDAAGSSVHRGQVLLQVLHHPEHQRTALPLSQTHKSNNICITI